MGIYTCIEFVRLFSQTNLCNTPKPCIGAVIAYKLINPKGGYGIPKQIAALGNGRGPYAHRFNPIEPFFTNYGGVLYMISDNLQEEIYRVPVKPYKDLTLASINGIIQKINILKALMETSMFLAGSQRTRVGVSRAISKGRKSFLSVN